MDITIYRRMFMLRLIYGMAKSGKTGMVMREINSLGLSGARDIKLIVPEQ